MQNGYNEDMLMNLQAKSIIDDKFWIIERNGEKIGTLRQGTELILTVNKKPFKFKDMSALVNKADIEFITSKQLAVTEELEEHNVHGWPCKTKPLNDIYDLKRKLPLYTKTKNSNAFYCAGYYVIKFEHGWVRSYCPKLFTLANNEYKGPFKTKFEMQEQLRKS